MFVLPQNAVIGCKPSLMNLKCIYKKNKHVIANKISNTGELLLMFFFSFYILHLVHTLFMLLFNVVILVVQLVSFFLYLPMIP